MGCSCSDKNVVTKSWKNCHTGKAAWGEFSIVTIVAIIVSVLVIITVIALVIYRMMKKNKKQQTMMNNNDMTMPQQ